MPAKVKAVARGSLADNVGIHGGDIVHTINGVELVDVLDYMYNSCGGIAEIQLDNRTVVIENGDYEPIGIEFESTLIDKPRSCGNKCVFCFIDQLPPHMRDTLYFKDDDYRLSFLQGNYISLTNLSERDINKIIEYNIPRINVSVHTTNPSLRVQMLNNKRAGDLMNIIKRFSDNNIQMNCQVVLCCGINDKEELDRTISDLAELSESVQSVSVVPVGLTDYRTGLADLLSFDKVSAMEVIAQVERWQNKLLKEIGTRFVYLGDEFYVTTGREVPPYEAYEDFLQIENGVGLMASFSNEFNEVFEKKINIKHKKTIITGECAYSFIKGLTDRLNCENLSVVKIKNNFFGDKITVAGLVTGCDIIAQLKERKNIGEILIPSCMLRYEDDVFLDDVSVGDIERELGAKITVVPINGIDFYKALLG